MPNARRWMVLILVSLAFFMVELDITVVNVALPSMQDELRFSTPQLQWVVNAYLLFFGGFLMLAGRAADLLGRKPMFLAGITVFGAGSAVCAIASSPTAVIAGRALQGMGGAMLAPTGLSTLTTTFTDTRERARALAIWTFIQTGSVALGLAVGGIITEVSWRWVFIINIPVAVLVLAIAPAVLPTMARATGRGFDVMGTLAITSGPALLIYALAGVPEHGWTSGRTIRLLAAAAVILAVLVPVESRSPNPLIRLGIFTIHTLTVGNLSFFLASSALFGMFFFSSLYVQNVLAFSPLAAGMALLPLAAGVLAGVTAAQKLLIRLDFRTIGAGGLLLAVVGAGLLAAITADSGYAWPFLPGLVLLSLGLGLAMVALTMLATSGVPESDAGLASGLFTSVSYIGGALGLAVLSSLAAGRTTAAMADGRSPVVAAVDGFRIAFIAAAVLLGAAAILIVALVRRGHLTALLHAPEQATQAAD